MGSGPTPDEQSRWAELDQDAVRQPTKPKPSESVDQDVLGIGEMSGEWSEAERSDAMTVQKEILRLVETIGCDIGSFSKEVIAKRTVAEIYSAPRVTKAANIMPSLGIAPGFALDLTT